MSRSARRLAGLSHVDSGFHWDQGHLSSVWSLVREQAADWRMLPWATVIRGRVRGQGR